MLVVKDRESKKNGFTLLQLKGKLKDTQLFQPLGKKLSYYNGKWFSCHHFGFKSFKKLTF